MSALARAQSVVFHRSGVQENEEYGSAVDGVGVGDVDRDGRDDLVVGAPSAPSGAGRAEVLSGADGSVLHAWVGAVVDGLGTTAALPIFGGILLVNPLAAVMLTSDLGGSASFAVPLSASPALSGAQVFLQGFVLDVGAPQGISMTPGLKLLIG